MLKSEASWKTLKSFCTEVLFSSLVVLGDFFSLNLFFSTDKSAMNRHIVWGRACNGYSWNRIHALYSSFTFHLETINSSFRTFVLASILTIFYAKPNAVSIAALLCVFSSVTLPSAAQHWEYQWFKVFWKDCVDLYLQQCFSARVCKGLLGFCSSPALEFPSLLH